MLTKLILFRENLKKIYAKAGTYIRHALTFVIAFAIMFLIGKNVGGNTIISSPLVALALALVCAFFPVNVTVIASMAYMITLLFGLSLELAIIALCVILIIFLLYFRFAPKTGFILLLTPLMFFMHIPYVIPVIVALTVGIGGIVPVIGGVFIYYLVDFASSFSKAIATMDADNPLQNITFIFNNILTNKELIVVVISFAVVIAVIYFIKRLSVPRAWPIAIVAGVLMDATIQMVTFSVLAVKYDLVLMIVGHLVAIIVGFILNFFVFSVDYSATEFVQFEDDDYYYYVKAVPKIKVAGKDVHVKKINDVTDVIPSIHTESYEDEDDINE